MLVHTYHTYLIPHITDVHVLLTSSVDVTEDIPTLHPTSYLLPLTSYLLPPNLRPEYFLLQANLKEPTYPLLSPFATTFARASVEGRYLVLSLFVPFTFLSGLHPLLLLNFLFLVFPIIYPRRLPKSRGEGLKSNCVFISFYFVQKGRCQLPTQIRRRRQQTKHRMARPAGHQLRAAAATITATAMLAASATPRPLPLHHRAIP